jgi:phage tail sheath protein FI
VVQRLVQTFGQARGDVVGVLTLPRHFQKEQCVEWLADFRQVLGLPAQGQFLDGPTDLADLSYVAVYHPWLMAPDAPGSTQLRAAPPDGAVCGMIAAREQRRQAWVAPANEPLVGVLDLDPELTTADWEELFALQFNLVRPEPRDFRAMSAHTLSDDRSLLQLSVRRLMILLRKLAAERGVDFVFESNHRRFRDGVRVMLENLLRSLFERGAFAGAAPEQAYRVATGDDVNTPEGIDQGRFVAEVRVAPSQPMEFLTVLLTRTGEGQLLAAEV